MNATDTEPTRGDRRRRGPQELGSDQDGKPLSRRPSPLGRRSRCSRWKAAVVEKVIPGRNFTCMIETVNAVEGSLGSLPGHVYANVRQPPFL